MRRARYFIKPKRTTRVLTLIGLIVCFWVLGLFRFVDTIPVRVIDESSSTDAIVVLTGGSLRLGKGLDLLAQGLSNNLFISGVYRGIDVQELLKVLKREPQQIENQISIGVAIDTKGNAIETKAWMISEKIQSLRLVTADYHMPRSLYEFKSVMPKERIIPHPVFPDKVKRERWWVWPGTASLLISEYNKFLFAWVRNEIEMLAYFKGNKEEHNLESNKSGDR